MDNSVLANISTKQLVSELKKREGVNYFDILPYSKYQINNESIQIDDIGPAILLIVVD